MLKSLFIALGIGAVLACCQCSVAYAASKTVTLSVPGMTCVTCPIAVKKSLSRVDVSFKDRQATVTFDDARATVEALTRATADAGFPSTAQP